MINLLLHELYIKKYYSVKEVDVILNSTRAAYIEQYKTRPVMIHRSIDFILHLMNKIEFIGLIRYTIVLMNSLQIPRLEIENSYYMRPKEDILQSMISKNKLFSSYIIVALYKYL